MEFKPPLSNSLQQHLNIDLTNNNIELRVEKINKNTIQMKWWKWNLAQWVANKNS